jgi:hypothetical protein
VNPGLGIEVQRATVARFAEAEGLTIISEYVEAETGKGADALDRRSQLAAALAAAKSTKCSVLVSTLDRLSRDVAFVAGLMAQRVPFSWHATLVLVLRRRHSQGASDRHANRAAPAHGSDERGNDGPGGVTKRRAASDGGAADGC